MEFRVYGVPAPQGSKTAFVSKRTGRSVVVEGSSATGRQKIKSWRAEVAAEAAAAFAAAGLEEVYDGPISVAIDFIMPKPKSAPKWKVWCDKRPDVDKLQRSTFDAMTGVIYKDDGQIAKLSVEKRYADMGEATGARIMVRPLVEAGRPASRAKAAAR